MADKAFFTHSFARSLAVLIIFTMLGLAAVAAFPGLVPGMGRLSVVELIHLTLMHPGMLRLGRFLCSNVVEQAREVPRIAKHGLCEDLLVHVGDTDPGHDNMITSFLGVCQVHSSMVQGIAGALLGKLIT